MSSTSDFSIVIPLFNKAGTIRRALTSVLQQTLPNYETVIVDDGSTDSGHDVALEVIQRDPRFRLIRQSNQGVSAARNRGISEATSEWIAFLDADDEWLPNHLQAMDTLRSQFPNCGVLGTLYSMGNDKGRTVPARIPGLPADFVGILADYFSIAAHSDPPLSASTIAIRRGELDAVGRFPVGISVGEDLLTWARLAVQCPIAYSTVPTAIFWRNCAPCLDLPPTRPPAEPDRVGTELRALLARCPRRQQSGLRQYIGAWHKMRASMYLRLGATSKCIREVLTAARWAPGMWQNYAYLLLALHPPPLRRRILRHIESRRSDSANGDSR